MVRRSVNLEMDWVGSGLEDRKFLASWASFALAAVPGALGSVYATARLAPSLTSLALAEWALLGVLMTVFGSISQLGMKPGYMQAVTDLGPTHRFGALRAGVVLQAVTGTLAGSTLAVALVVAHRFGYWQSVALLPWLPLQCALGNVAMMFHTDLRILGQARVVAMLSVMSLPLTVACLEIALRLGMDPLAASIATGCLASAFFIAVLAWRSGILRQRGFDRVFLNRAVNMGLAVMAGLLAKYVADLAVSSTFRWGVDAEAAGLYGFAVRTGEPLMALFIGAFQMAWGAHVYGWIAAASDGRIVADYSRRSWWLLPIGLPLGLLIAIVIRALTESPPELLGLLPFVLMILSRTLAFGLASSMGFGQTIERNYQRGMRILLLECATSATLVPGAAALGGAMAAVTIAAILPWISVFLLRRHSRRVLLKP